MQSALYKLEDLLSYRAASTRMTFARRHIGMLSHWVGVAGDLAGDLPTGMLRILSIAGSRGANVTRPAARG